MEGKRSLAEKQNTNMKFQREMVRVNPLKLKRTFWANISSTADEFNLKRLWHWLNNIHELVELQNLIKKLILLEKTEKLERVDGKWKENDFIFDKISVATCDNYANLFGFILLEIRNAKTEWNRDCEGVIKEVWVGWISFLQLIKLSRQYARCNS